MQMGRYAVSKKKPKEHLKMKHIVSIILCILATTAVAQTSKQAQALLSEVKTNTEGYTTQQIEFTNQIDAPTGKPDGSRNTRETTGTAQVKGQKFRAELDGIIILYDGRITYMIYPDDEEINVIDKDDDEGVALTPSSILAEYQTGYSYAMAGKETIDGKTIQYVMLKPKANAEVKEIMIGINMAKKQLYTFKQFGHNGVITTLTVTNYVTNIPIDDKTFSLNSPEFSTFELFE